jgi:hypothetical protein
MKTLAGNYYNFHFKVFKISILAFSYYNHAGWFRFFGFGLHWKDSTKHDLSFSERNGYRRYVKIGKWIVGYLPKYKL